MSPARIALLIALFPVAALRLPAQKPSEPAPSHSTGYSEEVVQDFTDNSVPTIHVTTRLVVLDVVASDGAGHPVKGLKPSDFTLTEDGVPQTITSLTEHDAAPTQSPALSSEPQLPPNTFTVQPPVTGNGVMTVIVLDVSPRWSPFVRGQVRDYLKTSTPNAPIAIFRLDWQGMHLVQGFTADQKLLLEAASSKRILPPLGFRTRYSYTVGRPTQHLAAYLSSVPGRINVIWLTDGGAPVGEIASELPDVSNFVSDLSTQTDIRRLSRVALYTVHIGGPAVPAADEIHFGSLTDDFDLASTNLPVIGLHDSDQAFMLADMDDVIAATGGRLFRFTDPKQAIAEVTATGSHYYTISYRPTNPNWNGAYRSIHLAAASLPNTPPPLRWSQLLTGWADDIEPKLLYRSGYFARTTPPARSSTADFGVPPPGATTLAPATPATGAISRRKLISVSAKGDPGPDPARMQAAMGFANLTPFDVHFTVVVTPSRRTQLTKPDDDLPRDNFLTPAFRDTPYRNFRIHYWIDPLDIHFVRTAMGLYHDDLQLVAIVYRDDGLAANSISTTHRMDLTADDMLAIQTSGITIDQTIAIPADGNFFLRAGVNEASTNHIGALEIPAEWIHSPGTP